MLARVRALVGPDVVIGAELDLHCHLTARMVQEATAIVIYKEYPHTDIRERAAELFAICDDAAAGRVRPVMAAAPLHMVGIFGTTARAAGRVRAADAGGGAGARHPVREPGTRLPLRGRRGRGRHDARGRGR